MKNADKFKTVFGMYATELWSMPEGEFLKWLNSECKETEQRWIPCSERLPEDEGEYLVSFDDGFIATTGYYDNDFELWADVGEPLAWMPLPEEYREEK